MPPPFDLVPPLLEGLWITLQLTFGGAFLAVIFAWVAGLGKLSGFRILRWPSILYIEVFRGTSTIIQLFWFFFALPLFGIRMTPMASGILVLGLSIGAYGAEVVRGGIQAVDRGQYEACTALNMSRIQSLRLVIVPQSLVAILPPAGNLLIELLKSTALVSLITLSDLTFKGMVLRAESLRTIEIFGMLLLIYFLLAQALSFLVRRLETALRRGWYAEESV